MIGGRAIVAAAVAIIASPALAGPDRASVMVGSHHLPGQYEGGFNDDTPGLFLTWESLGDTPLDGSIGAYVNSYGDLSVAATLSRLWPVAGDLHLGGFVGIAHYPDAHRKFSIRAGNLVPLFGLQARMGNFWGQYIPGDGRFTRGTLSGGITFRLGTSGGRE